MNRKRGGVYRDERAFGAQQEVQGRAQWALQPLQKMFFFAPLDLSQVICAP
eukprot:m.157119 g.157119  ORF g.157119 m.157119 type:complete len:51 (-) comp20845_c0_seq2:419-571(-)